VVHLQGTRAGIAIAGPGHQFTVRREGRPGERAGSEGQKPVPFSAEKPI